MDPFQYSVETDRDIIPSSAANQRAAHINVNCNENNLKRTNALGDSNMLDEQIRPPRGSEDVYVDVTGFTRSGDSRAVDTEDSDATECSSSFGDTKSGNEDGHGSSDAEVESQFHNDGSLASAFDGFSSLFPSRKKRLTAHWRNSIRPVMWRCKWIELKMRALKSQAAKYSKELEAYDKIKHAESDQITLQENGSRSLPYSVQSHRQKPMKRKKRKKVEETTDNKLFMSNHPLFSYLEKKKSDLDKTSNGYEFGNPVTEEQNATLIDEFGNYDDFSFLEDDNNDQEQTLRKIELVRTQVHKMKDKLDTIMTRYAYKFSSSESLSHLVPGEGQTSSFHSPTLSACDGDAISGYNFGATVSSYEAMLVPDIIESTVGLPSADVTRQQAQVEDSAEKILDNALIHNEPAEMEGQTLGDNNDGLAEKRQDSDNSREDESVDPSLPAASESTAVRSMSMEQSTLESCLDSKIPVPKNKRKRGERKPGPGGWLRQHTT